MKTKFYIIIALVLTITWINTIQAESVNNIIDNNLYRTKASTDANQQMFDPDAYHWLEVWFDSDFNQLTGMTLSPWESAGFDYLIQGTSLYNYSGPPGSDQWNWNLLWQYYIPRRMSSDNYSVEYSAGKYLFTEIPLLNKFGISVNPYYKGNNGTEKDFFPKKDNNFSSRKGYTVKPRTVVDIDSNLTSELVSGNAYFHPYMNSSNIDNYLDFQSGNDYTSNSTLWASWAINLIKPSIYKLRMNYQCSNNGRITLSLIDIKTNTISKIFIPTDYNTNMLMSENDLGTLDLTTIPAGMYMLKLKASNTNSFLKINKIILSEIESNTSSITEDQRKSHVDMSDMIDITIHKQSLKIVSEEKFDIRIFSLSGSMLHSYKNSSQIQINLVSGVYLIEFRKDECRFVKKIVI
jgi:hypothetical protein